MRLVSVTHKDHFIPVARGGTDNIKNIVALCGPCNMRKGKKTWDEFMEREILRQQFHGMGEHASDIGRAAYGQTNYAGPTGQAAESPGSVGTLLNFIYGAFKGLIIVPLAVLFGGLLILAAMGGKGQRRGSRLVEGASGAFGLYKLGRWAFGAQPASRFVGMILGGLLSAFYLVHVYNAPEARPASHDDQTPIARTHAATPTREEQIAISDRLREANRNLGQPATSDGPTAIRPLTMTRRFTSPAWTPPAVIAQPHGRMGPMIDLSPTASLGDKSPLRTSPGPGRRKWPGCGWWPIDSDADRDCAARQGHQTVLR